MKDLENIFEQGSIVSTRHGRQHNWIFNFILSSDLKKNIIEIELKQEYINDMLAKEETILIKTEKDNYYYIARGVVKDILIEQKRIIVKINSLQKFENKREEPRYDVRLNCIVKGIDFDDIGFSVIVDISKSGIGMVSRQNIALESKIFIDILLEEGKVLKLKGNPIRKRACGYNIEYGVKIEPIDEENKEKLLEFLKELEDREKKRTSVIKKLRSNVAAISE